MTAANTDRRGFLKRAGALGAAALVAPASATAVFAQETLSYRLVLRDESGRTIAEDRFRYDEADNTVWLTGADIRFGDETPKGAAPDFLYDAANRKLTVRSLLCHEIGDSVDIGGGRAGPDNAARDTDPETTESYARLVRFWGRSWVSDPKPGTDEPIGWDGGSDGEGFALCAEMTISAYGPQSATSRPGRLHLRTTPPGEHAPRDGLVVTSRQQLCAGADGEFSRPAWTFLSDRGTGLSRLKIDDSRVFMNVSVEGQRVADFRAVAGAASGLALAFMNGEGEMRFEAVEVGEPDSAGPGFRMLRVRN